RDKDPASGAFATPQYYSDTLSPRDAAGGASEQKKRQDDPGGHGAEQHGDHPSLTDLVGQRLFLLEGYRRPLDAVVDTVVTGVVLLASTAWRTKQKARQHHDDGRCLPRPHQNRFHHLIALDFPGAFTHD